MLIRRTDAALLALSLLTFSACAQQPASLHPTSLQPAAVTRPAPAARPAQAPDQAAMLRTTLEKLRVSSAKFTSAEANVQRITHTAIINQDEAPEIGKFYVTRDKEHKVQFGIQVNPPNARVVDYKDSVLRLDELDKKQCTVVTQPGVDAYLTLGFGGGPDELQQNWTVTDLGPETMANVRTEKLSLVPLNPKVRATYLKVVIWIDLERDVTLKQIFYATSNDTSTATYSNIRANVPVNPVPFAIPDCAAQKDKAQKGKHQGR